MNVLKVVFLSNFLQFFMCCFLELIHNLNEKAQYNTNLKPHLSRFEVISLNY